MARLLNTKKYFNLRKRAFSEKGKEIMKNIDNNVKFSKEDAFIYKNHPHNVSQAKYFQ